LLLLLLLRCAEQCCAYEQLLCHPAQHCGQQSTQDIRAVDTILLRYVPLMPPSQEGHQGYSTLQFSATTSTDSQQLDATPDESSDVMCLQTMSSHSSRGSICML
jgi:hypothetical protein